MCYLFKYVLLIYLFVYLFYIYLYVACYLFIYLFYLYLYVCLFTLVSVFVCAVSDVRVAVSAANTYKSNITRGHIFKIQKLNSIYEKIDFWLCSMNGLWQKLRLSGERLRRSNTNGERMRYGLIEISIYKIRNTINLSVVRFFIFLIIFNCKIRYTLNVCVVFFNVCNGPFYILKFSVGNLDCDILCCIVHIKIAFPQYALFIIFTVCYMLFICLFIDKCVNLIQSESEKYNINLNLNKIL